MKRLFTFRRLAWASVVVSMVVVVGWVIMRKKKLQRPLTSSSYRRVRQLQYIPTRQGRLYSDTEFEELCRLAEDPDFAVRCRALTALSRPRGSKQRKRAIETMRRALKDKQSFAVRIYGVGGLGRIGSREDVPYLLPLLQDAHPWVREKTVQVLERLGHQRK